MAYTQQPVPVQVQTISPLISTPDGGINNLTGGKSNEALVANLHSRYYQLTYRGVVFHGATAAAGVLLPVQNTTSPTFGVWNPAGSGVNVVMLLAYYGWVSTTAAPANIGYAFATGAGSAVATGSTISAFNVGAAAQNGLLGAGATSKVKFSSAGTNTLGAAGTILGTNGMSQLTTTGTQIACPMWTLIDDFQGTIIIPPGVFLYPTTSATAGLSLFDVRWAWAEFPI